MPPSPELPEPVPRPMPPVNIFSISMYWRILLPPLRPRNFFPSKKLTILPYIEVFPMKILCSGSRTSRVELL